MNSYAYNADQQLTMVQQQQQTGGNVVSPKEIDYGYNLLGQVTEHWPTTISSASARASTCSRGRILTTTAPA